MMMMMMMIMMTKTVSDRDPLVVRRHHWFANVPRCRTLVVTISVTTKSLLDVTNYKENLGKTRSKI